MLRTFHLSVSSVLLSIDNDQLLVEDDRDEGDRDAQEDERSEHEREGPSVANGMNDPGVVEGIEDDRNAESERAEGQREIDEGL